MEADTRFKFRKSKSLRLLWGFIGSCGLLGGIGLACLAVLGMRAHPIGAGLFVIAMASMLSALSAWLLWGALSSMVWRVEEGRIISTTRAFGLSRERRIDPDSRFYFARIAQFTRRGPKPIRRVILVRTGRARTFIASSSEYINMDEAFAWLISKPWIDARDITDRATLMR